MNTASEPPFSQALPWVLLPSFAFLLNYLARSIFGPLLPDLEQEFGISHAASTRLLFYMSAAYAFSLFLSGFSTSKARPRVMVAGALLVSGLALLAAAALKSLLFLSLSFACLGLAAGQQLNAGMIVIRNLTPPSQWGTSFAVHEMGPNICLLLGPILAAYGSSLIGWRGVASVLGWTIAASGLVFFFRARGGETPAAPVSFKNFRRALSEPVLWLFTWSIGLAVAGQFAPYSVLTLHMVDERNLAPESTAFLLSASRVGLPFAVLSSVWLTGRLGIRTMLTLCFSVYGLGMLLMAQPLFWPFAIGLFVQPLCTAMVFPALFTLLALRFPAEQPLFLGMSMPLASFFGLAFMPLILGLWGDYASFSAGFAMMGVLVLGSLPLVRRLRVKPG